MAVSANPCSNLSLKDKLLGFLGKSEPPKALVITPQPALPKTRDQALIRLNRSEELTPTEANHILDKIFTDRDYEYNTELLIEKIHQSNIHDPEVLEKLKKLQVRNPDTKALEDGLSYYLGVEEKAKDPARAAARKQLSLATGKPVSLKNGAIDLDQQKALAQDLISKLKGKLSSDLSTTESLELAQMADLIKLQNPNLEGLSTAEKKFISNLADKYEAKIAPLRSKNISFTVPGGYEKNAFDLAVTLRSMGLEVSQEGGKLTILSRNGMTSKNDDLLRFLLTKDGNLSTDPVISTLDPTELKRYMNRLQIDQGKISYKDPISDSTSASTMDDFINNQTYDKNSPTWLENTWWETNELKGGKVQGSSKSGFSSDPNDTRVIYWPQSKQGVGLDSMGGADGSELRIAKNKVGNREYIEVFVNTGENGKDNWVPMFYEKQGDKYVRRFIDAKNKEVPQGCVSCHTKDGKFSPIPSPNNRGDYKPDHIEGGDITKEMLKEGGHHH